MKRQIKLTKSQVEILRYYKSIGVADKDAGGVRFCRSIKTIAYDTDTGTKTVQRANDRFQSLGILIWRSGYKTSWGDGQPNQYLLALNGIRGYEILGVTSTMLRAVGRQVH
jgi:hypothetical protein